MTITREDMDLWGKMQLFRVLPYANAFRDMKVEQLRDMAWLELQKRQIEEADDAQKQLSVA